jgi:SAM-dependent methyltransferase
MGSDTWLYWYWGKEDKVEDDISRLLKEFENARVSKILDIGCGTGRHTIYFARKGFKLYGFDQSERAIKRAIELLQAERLSADLKVWNMTLHPLPYQDECFDAVLAVRVIHHAKLATINAIAKEIDRITAKRGYLYLQVPTEQKARRLLDEKQKCERLEERTFLPLEGDEAGVVHHYFTSGELLSLFKTYNLKNLHTANEHYCFTGIKR